MKGGWTSEEERQKGPFAWIGDKEAPRAEIATAGPSGALIHERGASTVPLKNVSGSVNVSSVFKLIFLL